MEDYVLLCLSLYNIIINKKNTYFGDGKISISYLFVLPKCSVNCSETLAPTPEPVPPDIDRKVIKPLRNRIVKLTFERIQFQSSFPRGKPNPNQPVNCHILH